jgi:hypothetical protein
VMMITITNLIERLSKFWIATVAAATLFAIVIVLTLIKLVTAGGDCGSVKIVSPSAGATISGPVRVQVEAEQPLCVERVSYSLAGTEFARPEAEIFETQLDPGALREKLPDLVEGEYELSISVEALTGRTEAMADSVKLRIEFPELTLEKIREMSEKLATRINQRGEIFVFTDEFLNQIRSAARGFRTDMFAGAESLGANIRRTSNSVGIPSQLMFLLAASRSRFSVEQPPAGCGVDPDGAGAFKVPRAIMNQFGVKAAVDNETATEVAARHLKELIQGQRDDFLYAVACFGEPSARIGDLFQRNDTQSRRNFYELVERGEVRSEESKRVICFFAAGIVAENPDKFGIDARSFVDIY